MSDIVVRSAPSEPEIVEKQPDPKPNLVGAEEYPEEPVTASNSDSVVLKALGIDDRVRNLPDEAQSYLTEVKEALSDYIKERGLRQEQSTYKRLLEDMKFDAGLDPDTDPDLVLKHLGTVLKSWKAIGFIRDPSERRAFFMKLARLPSSRAMNEAVMREAERRKIWQ